MRVLKNINLKPPLKVSRFLRIIITCLVSTVFALLIFSIFPEIAVVLMDINSEVMPTPDPLIKEVQEQWGSGLMIFIIAGTGMIKGDDFANSSVSSASSVHDDTRG
jgi:hypothetical protein